MFDIGFSELLLIAIVALIVVGPQRLPTTMRVLLRYFRQFKAGYQKVREEVERELALDELRETAQEVKQTVEHEVRTAVPLEELQSSAQTLRSSGEAMKSALGEVRQEVQQSMQVGAEVVQSKPVGTSASVAPSQQGGHPAQSAHAASSVAAASDTALDAASVAAADTALAAKTASSVSSSVETPQTSAAEETEPPIMTETDLAAWWASQEASQEGALTDTPAAAKPQSATPGIKPTTAAQAPTEQPEPASTKAPEPTTTQASTEQPVTPRDQEPTA